MEKPNPTGDDPGVQDPASTNTAGPDAAGRPIDGIALHETPGHLLRRAQQRAVDLFVQAVGEQGLRPPQFALLLAAWQNPEANQSELVRITGIDRSTAADMITRLAVRFGANPPDQAAPTGCASRPKALPRSKPRRIGSRAPRRTSSRPSRPASGRNSSRTCP